MKQEKENIADKENEMETWYEIEEFPKYEISDQKRIKRKEYYIDMLYNFTEKIMCLNASRFRKRTKGVWTIIVVPERIKKLFTPDQLNSNIEIWKDIEELPNFKISNLARVKRLAHSVDAKKHYKEKIVNQRNGTAWLYDEAGVLRATSVNILYRRILKELPDFKYQEKRMKSPKMRY